MAKDRIYGSLRTSEYARIPASNPELIELKGSFSARWGNSGESGLHGTHFVRLLAEYLTELADEAEAASPQVKELEADLFNTEIPVEHRKAMAIWLFRKGWRK